MFRYPLRFEPLLKTRVWGGESLPQRYGMEAAEPIGESWEICDHEEGTSTVANGPAAGKSLRELFEADRDALVGQAFDPKQPGKFPLMLKLLDARQDLSVQVHPDDDYADRRKPGELGKTEAWYILECEPGAAIYRGLKEGVTREDLAEAMQAGTVDQVLKRIEVQPGEVYHLSAGTVHALGAGVRIAEIQQNSDTTYRLFDWNRVGLDGTPRPLHIEDGLAVSDLSSSGPDRQEAEALDLDHCRGERFVHCDKFDFERLSAFTAPLSANTARQSFHILTCLSGQVTVNASEGTEVLGPWQTCLLPAAVGEYTLTGQDDATLLRFSITR